MRSLLAGRNWLWTLLVASLAFNVGFGATFGVRTYRHYCRDSGAGNPECAFRQGLIGQLDLTPEQQRSMLNRGAGCCKRWRSFASRSRASGRSWSIF